MSLKRVSRLGFVCLATIIGLYPLIYYFVDMHSKGLLQTKPHELLNNRVWYILFYIHITSGGLALVIGWSQFSRQFRNRFLKTHRIVGRIYFISVLLSSCAGLFVAFFASGGIVPAFGFGLLAILWFVSLANAYIAIRNGNFILHGQWTTRNYALTFAAVTLRIYLPLLIILFHGDFFPAYRIVSWLAWIPNLAVAELIIAKSNRVKLQAYNK